MTFFGGLITLLLVLMAILYLQLHIRLIAADRYEARDPGGKSVQPERLSIAWFKCVQSALAAQWPQDWLAIASRRCSHRHCTLQLFSWGFVTVG